MDFIKKVAIVVLFVIVILVPNSTFSVLLMVLAAAIIALYFHGLAGLITRKIKLPGKWSMFFSKQMPEYELINYIRKSYSEFLNSEKEQLYHPLRIPYRND